MIESLLGPGANFAKAAAAASERRRVAEFIVMMSELRAAGDIDGMMAYVADDIVCHSPATWKYALFPFTLRGKLAVHQGLRERHLQYEFLPSEVHRVLIDGDQSIVHRTTHLRPHGGGSMKSFDVVDLLIMRGALVCAFTEFPDGSARQQIGDFPR